MRVVGLALAILLACAGSAEAHRLKLFVTVETGTIKGYGFFIGGGRAQGAQVTVSDAAGAPVATLVTDAQGTFSYTPARPGAFGLRLDAGDGHVAEAQVGGDQVETSAPVELPVGQADLSPATLAALDAMISRATAAAVEREVRPLREAYAQAEGRARFNDVAGGIGMIIGLAGLAAWGLARRRRSGGDAA